MSNVKTNKFGGALLFILGEFAAADAEMIEDGGMEVFGEDDQGREGSCEVSINDLAQAASHEINHLTEQLAKANERVKELEDKHLNLALWHNLDPQKAKLYSDRYANKFAIEKKIEVLSKFKPISGAVANHWCDKEQKGYLWLHSEILAEIEKLEQLRKEQGE